MHENVTLKIIGSGDAFSSGGRHHTCFYIQSVDYQFLLDFGATAFVAFRQQNIPLYSLNSIVLTHLHGDHFGGIPFLLIAGMFDRARKFPLKIIGPEGTEAAIKKSLEVFYPSATGMDCVYHEYKAGHHHIDELEIFAAKAVHVPATNPHSLRIKFRNKIIAFSGDTGWYDGLKNIYNDADIFVCECSHTTPVSGHISYEELWAKRKSINAKRTVLTHMSEAVLQRDESIFERAFDGMEIRL